MPNTVARSEKHWLSVGEFYSANLGLHYMYYNFARPHKTLAKPYPRTPAMAAGVSDQIWAVEEILKLVE